MGGGWMEGLMRVWMDGGIDEWVVGWMEGLMGGWMDGGIDGWVVGWVGLIQIKYNSLDKTFKDPTDV